MTHGHKNSYEHAGLLEINGLSLAYDGKSLFESLSFTLAPGDTVWICGANGIGKTTLLKCAAGLIRPDTGALTWDGEDIQTAWRGGIAAYQGHHDAHKKDLSAAENLEFWQDIYGGEDGNVDAALKQVGLWERRQQRARTLSAGQSRRLSLARLLLRSAPLWVLDEPAAPMDARGRALIHGMLRAHTARGGSVLLASHRVPSKIGTSTRILTLNFNAKGEQ